MNLPKRPSLCALLLCVACDPHSQSLGEEPSETASGEGTRGDPVSAEAELLGQYVGAGIQHIDARPDGFVAAGGVGGYQGTFGDLALFDSHWVGAFNPDGTEAWHQEIEIWTTPSGELREQALTAVAAAQDGSVWVTIIDYGTFDEGLNELWKFDPDGTRVSQTNLFRRPSAVAATPDGGAIVAGYGPVVGDDNAVEAWAATYRSDGVNLDTRTWGTPDGRNTQFSSVAVTDSGYVLGGSWGTDPASSQAQAWFVFIEDTFDDSDDLDDVVTDVKLTATGATDRVRALRVDGDGTVVATVDISDSAIVTLSPTGEVLSTELVHPDVVMWSPYSATGFLGGDRNNCFESIGGDGCGQATFSGFESGERLWEVPVEGCDAINGFALDANESIASVGCNFMNEDGDWDVRAELHRILAD